MSKKFLESGRQDRSPMQITEKISAQDKKLLKDHCKFLLKALRLSHWMLYIDFKTQHEDSLAGVNVDAQYHSAMMYLSDEFYTSNREEQNLALLHEFAHILIGGYVRLAETTFGAPFNPEAMRDTKNHMLKESEEALANQIAMILYDTLPRMKKIGKKGPKDGFEKIN